MTCLASPLAGSRPPPNKEPAPLSGKGPITFPFISRWRRATFSNLTGAVGGSPQPAPSNIQFNPSTTAANLAAQQAGAMQPLPPFRGKTQTAPVQVA
jgi:phospholipase C